MKKNFIVTLLMLTLGLLSQKVRAQGDISNVFKAGGDLNQVATGYIKPLGVGFATGMGSNWYSTASTHKTLGFDITVKAGAIFVPTSDQTFDLTTLSKNLVPDGGAKTAPTFAGSGKGVGLTLYSPSTTINGTSIGPQKLTSLTTPDGVSNIFPTVCVQGSIGLPLKTELTVRYLPKLPLQSVNCSLWGVGIKHDIKQWIPGISLLPFSLSVMAAYTKFDMDYSFDNKITPALLTNNPTELDAAAKSIVYSNSNQGFGISSTSLMANVLISKDLLFFTPYLGLGFSQNNFHFGFNGDYPYLSSINQPKTIATTTTPRTVVYNVSNLNNPVQLDYNTFMPGATVGFKLNFVILHINAQYTFQQYPVASLGLGLGIR